MKRERSVIKNSKLNFPQEVRVKYIAGTNNLLEEKQKNKENSSSAREPHSYSFKNGNTREIWKHMQEAEL